MPLLVGVALVAAACGPAGAGGGGGDRPGGSLRGTLIVEGSGKVHTLELGESPTWTERIDYRDEAGDALSAVDERSNRFHTARFTSADTFYVESFDLASFETLGESFEWPETSNREEMRGLAFSPDGRYAAAVMTFVGSPLLSVVDVSTNPPVELLSEFAGSIGDDLVWLDDSHVAFVLDVSDQDVEPVAEMDGAIVSLNVPETVRTGQLDLNVHVGFSGESWTRPENVRGLALSPDGHQLAFSFSDGSSPAVMLKDLTESGFQFHQLTAGPISHVGPAFSPDGTMVAFVEGVQGYEASVFAVPNHRDQPIVIENAGPVRERHLVSRGLAYRVLAWLP